MTPVLPAECAAVAMQAFYSDHFVLPLPQGHRFPMPKYRLLRERIEGAPGFRLREK